MQQYAASTKHLFGATQHTGERRGQNHASNCVLGLGYTLQHSSCAFKSRFDELLLCVVPLGQERRSHVEDIVSTLQTSKRQLSFLSTSSAAAKLKAKFPQRLERRQPHLDHLVKAALLQQIGFVQSQLARKCLRMQ